MAMQYAGAKPNSDVFSNLWHEMNQLQSEIPKSLRISFPLIQLPLTRILSPVTVKFFPICIFWKTDSLLPCLSLESFFPKMGNNLEVKVLSEYCLQLKG